MHLVEIGQRVILVGDIAQFADGGDVAIHRINRLEADELGPVGDHAVEQARQVGGVVVPEDVFFGAAVADAGDHRGMVEGVRQHHRSRHLARERRECSIVGDIIRGEDQCRLAAVQIGDLAFEQQVQVIVTGDVAGAPRTRTHGPQRLLHRREDCGVLAHAEVVV